MEIILKKEGERILLVLRARVLLIKFIQFRDTFRHYIQTLILTINIKLAIALLGTSQNCTRTKLQDDKTSRRQNSTNTKLNKKKIAQRQFCAEGHFCTIEENSYKKRCINRKSKKKYVIDRGLRATVIQK